MLVIKRNGKRVAYDDTKLQNAMGKAMLETGDIDAEVINNVIKQIEDTLEKENAKEVTVELLQDMIEDRLSRVRPDVAKRYILYRDARAKLRKQGWTLDELQRAIYENKYRYENETFDEFLERISGGNERIKKRIRNKQFLFGGRILANRGLQEKGYKVTYSNCYVIKPPKDDLEEIFEVAKKMARTYSYGGGCGTSLRYLRPEGAKVHNNARTTTGSTTWMHIYSETTLRVGQKGRRGALMISIPSKHPDILQFINIKTEQGAVTGANISIEIDNEFMIAAKENKPYELYFKVEDTGEEIRKVVNAKEVYETIIRNNWDWAEPGALFWDRISNYHLMSNDPEFEFGGTNPCAEEPLPPGGSCLLGSINLSEFVVAPFTDKAGFDFESFVETIHDAVVALNEVLDEGLGLHPLEEQRQAVRDLRQIGLGVMGIADMLIKLGMTYGSTKSLALCEVLAHIMINEAMKESAYLANKYGTFGKYSWKHIEDSIFFQTVASPETKEIVKRYGLRNSQILCIAPTGSISTMFGVSGGIEPIFELEFYRTTKSLHGKDVKYKVYADIVNQYFETNNIENRDNHELPECFVTSMTLNWKNRIEMQAVWQKYIDASISSTINLRKDITIEETMDLYMYAWEMGLKGCTIYRDGCKRAGILTLDDEEDNTNDFYEGVEGEKVEGYFSTCPECKQAERGNGDMVFANGCATCRECGFSPCA